LCMWGVCEGKYLGPLVLFVGGWWGGGGGGGGGTFIFGMFAHTFISDGTECRYCASLRIQ